MLHQNGGVKTKEEESRDSRMRDPVQEEDEGNFQTDVMGNSRKPLRSRQMVQIGEAGRKMCLQEYGETGRLLNSKY